MWQTTDDRPRYGICVTKGGIACARAIPPKNRKIGASRGIEDWHWMWILIIHTPLGAVSTAEDHLLVKTRWMRCLITGWAAAGSQHATFMTSLVFDDVRNTSLQAADWWQTVRLLEVSASKCWKPLMIGICLLDGETLLVACWVVWNEDSRTPFRWRTTPIICEAMQKSSKAMFDCMWGCVKMVLPPREYYGTEPQFTP